METKTDLIENKLTGELAAHEMALFFTSAVTRNIKFVSNKMFEADINTNKKLVSRENLSKLHVYDKLLFVVLILFMVKVKRAKQGKVIV